MRFNLFDAHCDSLTNTQGDFGEYDGEFSVKKAREFASFVQVAAIWIDSSEHSPWVRACKYADILQKSSGFNFIKTSVDFKIGGVGIILGIEGGEAIEGDLLKLSKLYDMGVRVFGLTWNTPNEISGTAMGDGSGLTDFGRDVVRKAEQLGMVIDVSHISEKGFYDVAAVLKKPFIASHSNSKTLCNHPRNLTDEQFKVIIKRGGVAGINYHTDFLGKYKGTEGITAHIEHFMSLGGEANIGLGSDFDGGIILPDGISDVRGHEKVLEALLKRNYSEEQVKNIAENNFKRVFFEILDKKCCIL